MVAFAVNRLPIARGLVLANCTHAQKSAKRVFKPFRGRLNPRWVATVVTNCDARVEYEMPGPTAAIRGAGASVFLAFLLDSAAYWDSMWNKVEFLGTAIHGEVVLGEGIFMLFCIGFAGFFGIGNGWLPWKHDDP